MSLVWPGAGHVYLGQVGKGLALMVVLVVSSLLIAVGIGLLTTPALVIYTVYDAYTTAKQRNRGAAPV
jgi:TM2 domain-containing membrane protein YozV